MDEHKRSVLWWGLAMLYLAVIATAWARPEFSADYAIRWLTRMLPWETPSLIRLIVVGGRKLAHFVGYYAFTAVLANALLLTAPAPTSRQAARARVVIAALGAVALAALDESRQSLSPFRTGAAADIILDVGGIAVATMLLMVRSGRAHQR